jgi:hypothetical protein
MHVPPFALMKGEVFPALHYKGLCGEMGARGSVVG